MQVSRVLSRTCQRVVRSSVTRSVNPALQWRFSSTQAAAPTTPAATEEIGWWSPSETKLKPIPKESEKMINEDGTEGEVIHKVVNVGGVRPDGRSPKWFTTTSTAHVGRGYTFLLDERGAQTQTEPLIVPSESLAVALSLEWAAQGKHILPDTLPLTRLATMAIDQMPTSRDRIINNMMYTFDADLACVRIEEEVFAQQKKTFTPMIEWFAEKFGYKPKVSILFGKLKHPPQLVQAVREYLTSLDNFKLQALDHLTSATRSIILSLYLTHGKTGVEEGIKAARIEEDSQTSTWGVVVGTHDVDRTEISIRISVATLFWRLLEQK